MATNNYIEQIIEKLKPLNPHKVILFGSYAEGINTKDSDIDLLVVTNDDFIPQNFREKLNIKLKIACEIEELRRKVPIDLLVYTKPMFAKFLALDSMFCREILNKGIVIYESHHQSVA